LTQVPTFDFAAQAQAPAYPRLHCGVRQVATGAAWIHADGELDLEASPGLRELLLEAVRSTRLVILDLRALTFIDSAGIHAILDAATATRRDGGSLVVVRGPAQVERVFEISRANEHLLLFDLDPSEGPEQGPPGSGVSV
jgi:anti-sigma B factor antagonist